MDKWPFSRDEWSQVHMCACAYTQAVLKDMPFETHLWMGRLRTRLAKLRAKYGAHPVLIETLADFEEDEACSIRLYRKALAAAIRHSLPTYTICLSLAECLQQTKPAEAIRLLNGCKSETLASHDTSDIEKWNTIYEIASSKKRAGTTRD